MATQAPFPVNGELTAVAVSYRNRALIADLVLPRVPVMQSEFKYMKYDKDSGFTIPDTKIGRKSEANIVETGGVEVTDSTVDYALKDVVPMTDLANAPDGYDPKARGTEFTTNLLDLAREVRAANLVFSTAQYGTANKATLSGTSQWSDTTSDPIGAILDAMDSMLLRPTVLTLGGAVWTKLRTHPKVVAAVLGNSGTSGAVSREALAEVLELDDILVGQSFVNTAAKGATAAFSQCWGKHAALLYRDTLAGNEGITFGFTASFMGREVRDWFNPELGRSGADVVQVADSVKEIVSANDLGYLFANAVA